MTARPAALSLLVGNFVVGVCVLGPTGMLNQLAPDLGVSIAEAGLLVTCGAVVLCLGSPLVSWLTSRLDRRLLLTGSLLLVALGQLASAFAPSFAALLVIRVVGVAAAAPYTPQAASTIALLVPEKERARAIAFVFLGWSLSVAAGLPLVTLVTAHLGWRAGFAAIAGAALLGAALLAVRLPAGLRGAAVSIASWIAIARHRQIRLLLVLTAVQVAGQFAIFTYLGALLVILAGAGSATIGACFAIFGVTGFAGNVIATRVVTGLGALRTTLIFMCSILAGVMLWSFGAGAILVMAAGLAVWGLGFAAVNSMQQARLVAARPDLAAGSVALNTSSIYVGQAVGSAVGGFLLARALPLAIGHAAIGFVIAALILLLFTRGPGERL
ncbi:MAG TPA: MFS transporter [Kofleriaceae bacterium]|nr:MFS transporter [Kofleriaceae bacterium]